MNYDIGNTKPWVTFCMTTYKRPDFLRNQLKCILAQTVQGFKVVVSDNDPGGSAKPVIDEINDDRIEYYVNEVNLGMVKSFNRSLAKADTEFVVMITDDDPPYPEMLEELLNLANKYPGFGMYYGGFDLKCTTKVVARSARAKVGLNSSLADLDIGTVRTFSGKEFVNAYLDKSIGCHLLWSTGIVRRSIANKIGGMPDFGAPYNTDYGYMILAGADSGVVLLNTSLGCQVVHGNNYGFSEANFEKFYLTAESFCNWVFERLPAGMLNDELIRKIQTFNARWAVEYAVSIKKYTKDTKEHKEKFDYWVKKLFQIPFMKKWKFKYLLAVHFPSVFRVALYIKAALGKP